MCGSLATGRLIQSPDSRPNQQLLMTKGLSLEEKTWCRKSRACSLLSQSQGIQSSEQWSAVAPSHGIGKQTRTVHHPRSVQEGGWSGKEGRIAAESVSYSKNTPPKFDLICKNRNECMDFPMSRTADLYRQTKWQVRQSTERTRLVEPREK